MQNRTRQLNADGQEPSEWLTSTYAGFYSDCDEPLEAKSRFDHELRGYKVLDTFEPNVG